MIDEKQRLKQIENQIKQLQKELDEIKKQFKKGPRLIFQTTMKEAQYMSLKNLITTDMAHQSVQNAVNRKSSNVLPQTIDVTGPSSSNTEATNTEQSNTEATNIKQFNTEATNTFNELLNDPSPFNLESNQPQWFNEPLSETSSFTPF